MHAGAGWRKIRAGRLPFLVLLLLGSAASGSAHGQEPEPGESPAPSAQAAPTVRRLRTPGPLLVLALRTARAATFETLARQGDRAFTDLLRRAGAVTPPHLPAARVAELQALRREALDLLRAELDPGSPTCGRRMALLRGILDGEETPDALWIAAASSAAELDLAELAEPMARGLGPDVGDLRPAGARRALHRLCRRWFAGPEDFATFWSSASNRPRGSFYLQTLEDLEAQARERLARILQESPDEAAAWLDDPDPGNRALAARAMGEAIAAGALGSEDGIPALLDHLATERDSAAFHALLEALIAPLVGAAHGDPAVVRLRGMLAAAVECGYDPLQIPAARALSRLPWDAGPEGKEDLLSAVELLARMLEGTAASPSPTVADVTFAGLHSLRSLCAQAEREGLGERLRGSAARAPVIRLLSDPEQGSGVRIAAAGALSTLALPGDAAALVALLEREDAGPGLRYALLASLGATARGLDPESGDAERVLTCILAFAADPDADLQRQALELLASEGIAPLLRRGHLYPLTRRLGTGASRELDDRILELLGRFGGPADLPDVLAIEAFGSLVESDPRRVAVMASTLAHLAAGEGGRVLQGARRLVDVIDPATRIARLEAALDLVAALDEEQATALGAEQHAVVVEWALSLRRAGGSLPRPEPEGQPFAHRLLEVHLGAAADGSDPGVAARLAWHRALFLGDLVIAEGAGERAGEVEALFADALARAEGEGSGLPSLEVQRDRARFRAAVMDSAGAVADFRALLDAGAAERAAEASGTNGDHGNGSSALLDPSDLRGAAFHLARVARQATEGRAAGLAEAFDVLWLLGRDPRWRSEPGALRVQDLRELLGWADEAGDRERLELLAAALQDLPAPPAEPPEGEPPPPEPEPPPDALWWGLQQEAEQRGALGEIAAGVAEALGRLSPPPEEPPPAAEAGEPGEPGTGGGS